MVLEQRARNWAYLRKESAFKWRLIKTLSHKRCSSNLKEWLFQRCSTFPKYLEELAWKSEYCNFRQLIWYFLIKRLNARTEIWILNKLLIYLYYIYTLQQEKVFVCRTQCEIVLQGNGANGNNGYQAGSSEVSERYRAKVSFL